MTGDRKPGAAIPPEPSEDTQEGKFLTFALGSEEYGIEIRHVTEIIGMQRITELPDVADYIRGVINLRGKVIAVMDARLRFGLPLRPYDERTCIIVVDIRETIVGVIVDSVSEVLDIPEQNIEPPPKVNRSAGSRYIRSLGKVGDQVKILLDIDKLFFDDEAIQIIEADKSVEQN
jgi:purine-binding chemotaxis protein CheW